MAHTALGKPQSLVIYTDVSFMTCLLSQGRNISEQLVVQVTTNFMIAAS